MDVNIHSVEQIKQQLKAANKVFRDMTVLGSAVARKALLAQKDLVDELTWKLEYFDDKENISGEQVSESRQQSTRIRDQSSSPDLFLAQPPSPDPSDIQDEPNSTVGKIIDKKNSSRSRYHSAQYKIRRDEPTPVPKLRSISESNLQLANGHGTPIKRSSVKGNVADDRNAHRRTISSVGSTDSESAHRHKKPKGQAVTNTSRDPKTIVDKPKAASKPKRPSHPKLVPFTGPKPNPFEKSIAFTKPRQPDTHSPDWFEKQAGLACAREIDAIPRIDLLKHERYMEDHLAQKHLDVVKQANVERIRVEHEKVQAKRERAERRRIKEAEIIAKEGATYSENLNGVSANIGKAKVEKPKEKAKSSEKKGALWSKYAKEVQRPIDGTAIGFGVIKDMASRASGAVKSATSPGRTTAAARNSPQPATPSEKNATALPIRNPRPTQQTSETSQQPSQSNPTTALRLQHATVSSAAKAAGAATPKRAAKPAPAKMNAFDRLFGTKSKAQVKTNITTSRVSISSRVSPRNATASGRIAQGSAGLGAEPLHCSSMNHQSGDREMNRKGVKSCPVGVSDVSEKDLKETDDIDSLFEGSE